MANLGFILKESVMKASEKMNDKDFRILIERLFDYAVKGAEPDEFDWEHLGLDQTDLARAIFEMEKPAIDYNNSKWGEKKRYLRDKDLPF